MVTTDRDNRNVYSINEPKALQMIRISSNILKQSNTYYFQSPSASNTTIIGKYNTTTPTFNVINDSEQRKVQPTFNTTIYGKYIPPSIQHYTESIFYHQYNNIHNVYSTINTTLYGKYIPPTIATISVTYVPPSI
jgi:hypothetical protein